MIKLTDQEKQILSTAKMNQRIGFGKKPALIIIDMQVYMMGDKREPIMESIKSYPSSTGEMAWNAADNIKKLINKCHSKNYPVIYTYMALKRDGSDAGIFKMKRDFLFTEHWMIEGTHGAEIAPSIKPREQDYIIKKSRFSAFFGTSLETYLRDNSIDTLILTGGSTSNCVRATVFDSASYGYHTIVASDCLCDRMITAHEVNLRDMDRQFADVMTSDEIISAMP